jgi:hypothetical protein
MERTDLGDDVRDPGHFIGLHAPALQRFAVALALGLIVFALARRWLRWPLAMLIGWDTAAF